MADGPTFNTISVLYGQAWQYRTEILELRQERDRYRQALKDILTTARRIEYTGHIEAFEVAMADAEHLLADAMTEEKPSHA